MKDAKASLNATSNDVDTSMTSRGTALNISISEFVKKATLPGQNPDRAGTTAVRESEAGTAETGGDARLSLKEADTGYYDYSKSFSEQVDDWLNGKFPQRDTLLLGRTPNVLRKIGFSDLPMTMDQKHMRMMLGRPKNVDHDLSVAIVKKLPELIADPVAVIADPRSGQNGRKQTAIVVFAQKNPKVPDRPVIGVVNVLENGKINGISIDSTFVETVHSRGDLTSRITEAVERENAGEVGVFYIKKRSHIAT